MRYIRSKKNWRSARAAWADIAKKNRPTGTRYSEHTATHWVYNVRRPKSESRKGPGRKKYLALLKKLKSR